LLLLLLLQLLLLPPSAEVPSAADRASVLKVADATAAMGARNWKKNKGVKRKSWYHDKMVPHV
jgi:hypothetical protein